MLKRITRKIFGEIWFARKIGVTVGENCEFQKNIDFGSEPYLISIGDNVRITQGCKFITHDGGMWTLRKMKLLENSDVFGKIVIGNNCIVGCGAVVTHNVPDNTIVGGVPARRIKTIEEYYQKQKEICDYTKNMNRDEKKKYLLKKYKEDI